MGASGSSGRPRSAAPANSEARSSRIPCPGANLPLPEAQTLSISWAPYLNGLGETVGELRRYVLDQLRRGNIDQCEVFLRHMDDIYALLTLVDFPDAITLGLRRTTDTARSILEKTRGDLTMAVSQAQLQQRMLALQQELQNYNKL